MGQTCSQTADEQDGSGSAAAVATSGGLARTVLNLEIISGR